MTKPHEDNWEHMSGEYPDTVYRAGTQSKIADVWADGIESGNDTADLIAAAPEMARLLLRMRDEAVFIGREDDDEWKAAIVAVLRKAGVIPPAAPAE